MFSKISNLCKQDSLMLNESKSIKFVFDFDNFPIQSIDNFLNLGVIFDSSFNMSSFKNNKIRKSNYQLFRICGIRKSLTFKRILTLKNLVTNIVLSIIDYCDILLSGFLAYKIKPL